TTTSAEIPIKAKGGSSYLKLSGGYRFTHTISPASLFYESDIPNLTGLPKVSPPGERILVRPDWLPGRTGNGIVRGKLGRSLPSQQDIPYIAKILRPKFIPPRMWLETTILHLKTKRTTHIDT